METQIEEVSGAISDDSARNHAASAERRTIKKQSECAEKNVKKPTYFVVTVRCDEQYKVYISQTVQ